MTAAGIDVGQQQLVDQVGFPSVPANQRGVDSVLSSSGVIWLPVTGSVGVGVVVGGAEHEPSISVHTATTVTTPAGRVPRARQKEFGVTRFLTAQLTTVGSPTSVRATAVCLVVA